MPRTKKAAAVAVEEPAATPAATAEKPRTFIRARNVGMSGEKPYAFHLEGTLTRDLNVLTATEDKKAAAYGSIGIGTDANGVDIDADAVYARATKEEAPATEKPTPFVNLVFYDRLAEKVASDEAVKKGALLAVSGVLRKNTGKDGVSRVEVLVDNYAVLRRDDGKRNKRISVAPMTYTNSNKEVVSKTMVTLLTGKVLKNITQGQSGTSGIPYLRAGLLLAVPVKKVYDLASTGKVGEYAENAPAILNLVFFDKLATRMGKLLREGMIIAVTGEVSEEIYNGNTSYTMRPQTVSVVNYGSGSAGSATGTAPEAAPIDPGTGFADLGDEDDGMELPF